MIVGGRVEFLCVNFMSEEKVHNTTRSDLEQESSWSRFRTMNPNFPPTMDIYFRQGSNLYMFG